MNRVESKPGVNVVMLRYVDDVVVRVDVDDVVSSTNESS